MKELDDKLLKNVSGAWAPPTQANAIGAAIIAGTLAGIPGGIPGVLIGATLAGVTTAIGFIPGNHGR
ncbi:hypothetical protein [Xenorhabdus innexi]|uniref:Microcin H47 n=1 Tax=Xenorhabdus innexi TaxID=290109 RepID=A0A1N6N0W3_9GAMM|nr:hypothetical protein [Xenorhabdus innexi]PHM28329.1 hypothetical protein Xinn_03856 [Xenorhabdus innexi]PHM28330.1 hypothetical protein Xinn_03857 [Xenorhabdus innexi]PHM28331.1 hypothetical protein Xinn_03858 [Xenorhabdus innexi]SIP74679.1 Microcin H47 [Xenorhabdus innexi]SIP74680.1 Microcin H47 [Xenorhabdus innexi]